MSQNFGSKSASALLNFLWDKAIENWPPLVLYLVSGGAMTYLASISHWLDPYGPVAWGFVGLLAIVVVASAGALYGYMRQRIATADYAALRSSGEKINVLSPAHQHERIQVSELWHPLSPMTKRVRFDSCELLGPANVHLTGATTVADSRFTNCQIALVKSDIPIIGMVVFEDCQIYDCTLHSLIFMMTHANWLALPQQMRNSLMVISDGTVGKI